jgi:solute carrier family 13 (sodium-dependent dicarboxylate transporter), member 2/3/5
MHQVQNPPGPASDEDNPARSASPRDAYKFALAGGAFLLFWFLLSGLEPPQRAVGAVFAAAAVLWVSEALPLAVTALMSTVALVVLGVAPPREIFSSYGDPIIFLFLGSFLLAKSMTTSGLDRRLAFLLLRHEWATRSPGRVMLSMGLIACTISLFVSNTAVTAMLLPIGLSVLRVMGEDDRQRPFSTGLLLMVAWGSTIAVGTILSTPPNLIGVSHIERVTGLRIGFVDWMLFAMPITLVMLFATWLVLMALYGRGARRASGTASLARAELMSMGRLTAPERNTMIAFSTALALWLAPAVLQATHGREHVVAVWANDRITTPVAALVGAFMLFLLRVPGGAPTLKWERAATIDWGTILLFGGGIALGRAMFDTGLASLAGTSLANLTGVSTLWGVTGLSALLSTTVSELASNTASATTIVPVSIGLAESAGVSVIAPALGATLGASLGFTLPVSTPPNAIVYSSGLVKPSQMMAAGLIMDVVGFATVMLVLRYALTAMGLA